MNHYCKYCDKYFHYKNLFEQHVITCEYIYRNANDKNKQDCNDFHETVPTNKQQFKLIQYLMFQVNHLTKEVSKLRQNTVVRTKKMIIDHLNNSSYPKPPLIFEQWKLQIPTSFDDLECVFQGDLTNGVQNIFKKLLQQDANAILTIPIRAFHQKPATFYIYSCTEDQEQPKWKIMDPNEYLVFFNRIGHKLLQEFLRWQTHYAEEIRTNMKLNEDLIDYQYKINGMGFKYEERRRAECKKWLFNQFATNFTGEIAVA